MLKPAVFATAFAAALILVCASASAQQALVAGTIQKVSYQPRGADDCPDPCPRMEARLADGSTRICISNGGGCESIELKVERDFYGTSPRGSLRRFEKRIGEFGPTFPVTSRLIVIRQDGERLHWTPAVLRDGRVHVVPDSFNSLARQASIDWIRDDHPALAPLDVVAKH